MQWAAHESSATNRVTGGACTSLRRPMSSPARSACAWQGPDTEMFQGSRKHVSRKVGERAK